MASETGARGRAHRPPGGLAVAALVVLAFLASACGAPEYTYVTNSDDHTYLKVPAAWAPIDSAQLLDSLGADPSSTPEQNGLWVQGYDAATPPTAAHLVGPVSDQPALFVAVWKVPEEVRGKVSLDQLRDFFRPVTPASRQMAALGSAVPLSDFALMQDETLTPGQGLRGVHSVYQYRIGNGPKVVFDQTLYTNDDASKLYMFYVRCSVDCYKQRQREIGSVVSSFTVREKS